MENHAAALTRPPHTLPKILLVDDEPRILRSLKAALRSKYRIVTASNGYDAKDLLNKHKDISVVVSDERMPKLLGHELLCWVKINYPRCSRVLMTGYSDIEALQNSINDAEIYRYLTKPWDLPKLKETIDNAIALSKTAQLNPQLKTVENKKEKCDIVVLDRQNESEKIYKKLAWSISQDLHTFSEPSSVINELQDNPHVGVLFVDTNCGDESTIELVCEVHKTYPNIIVIIVTSAVNGTSAIQMLNEGQIFRYLVKPVTLTRLKPMILAAVKKFSQNLKKHEAVLNHLSSHQEEDDISSFWSKVTSFWHKH